MRGLLSALDAPLTTPRVQQMVRALDWYLDGPAANGAGYRGEDFRAWLDLRDRRVRLKLLLVARRVEGAQKVVSLERWRNGYLPPPSAANSAEPSAE